MVGSTCARATVVVAVIAANTLDLDTTHAQPCVPAWSDHFSLGDFNSWIWDLVVHDDGNGPAVYACGNFTRAGNTPTNRLARLNGTEWAPVGETFDNQVYRLASSADWPLVGPLLFAGGWFENVGDQEVNHIAQWDGTSWAPLGAGLTTTLPAPSLVVPMLFVVDAFGEGPALFAGGYFDTAGEVPALNIARWDGANWSALGDGLAGWVDQLAWFDDGSGPALYAIGTFPDIMRWDGLTWTAVDTGFDIDASDMVVHDEGSGPALFVSGSVPAEGGSVGIVVRRNGVGWAQVGATFDEGVYKLGAFDVGAGPVLGASGSFLHVGATEVTRIAAWDGVSWSPLDAGIDMPAYGMVSLPGQASMFAGGFFHAAGGMDIESFARWDGSAWSAVGNGVAGDGYTAFVGSMVVFNDGSGPAVYAAGKFSSACGAPAVSLVRWDGAHGSPVGGGINGLVHAMEVVQDPALGAGLYVGGYFLQAGQTPVSSIARWDGATWTALGGGVNGIVWALQVYDDGSGPALYVGGQFSRAGSVGASNIARWDGQQWSSVGVWPPNSTMLDQGLPGDDGVRALAVFGGTLYAGGGFGGPSMVPEGLARLDGDRWQPVGDGIMGEVLAMKVFDDGNGPALFVGGDYCILPDDADICDLARWDGSGWTGVGLPGPAVRALEVYDDGTGHGPRLYAGGSLYYFPDPAMSHIAAWDGNEWSPLASGVGPGVPYPSSAYVLAMTVFDDGLDDGDALYAGGVFDTVGDLLSSNLARWGGCGNFVLGDLTGDGVVGIDDFDALLAAWGPCPDCASCPADLDGDCVVGIRDLLILLAHWS